MSTPTTDRGGIQQIIRALRADGWELEYVRADGDQQAVTNEAQALEEIMAYDRARLVVRKGMERGWVLFVLGNSPEEVAADWTVNLTPVDRITDGW